MTNIIDISKKFTDMDFPSFLQELSHEIKVNGKEKSKGVVIVINEDDKDMEVQIRSSSNLSPSELVFLLENVKIKVLLDTISQ